MNTRTCKKCGELMRLPESHTTQYSNFWSCQHCGNVDWDSPVNSSTAQKVCAKYTPQLVYVVIANDCERVKECMVFSDDERAKEYFDVCKENYGGANVALWARAVDDVPDNLFGAILEK